MLASGELADTAASVQPPALVEGDSARSELTDPQNGLAASPDESLEAADHHESEQDVVEASEDRPATHDPTEL
jgi:hypothetical protein